MAQRFEIDAVFRAIDQITGPIRRMSRNVGRAADRMSKKFGKVNRVIDQVGSGIARVAKAGIAAGLVVATGLGHAVVVGAEFEQVLINAGERLGQIRLGSAAFEELEAAAIAMSSATEFGAKDAAGALKFMGTAGENAAVAMGTLSLFADSATAGEVELARAADIASDSIGALGLGLDANGKALSDTEKIVNYARTIDLMTAAHSGANLTLNDVFETVKKSAGIFVGAGQSVETFFAATQVVSSLKKGSEAGTQLRIVMNNLLATTGQSAKAMRSLRDASGRRIKLKLDDGSIRALPDILDDVNAGLARFDELKAKQTRKLLFGEGEAVGSLLLQQVDDLRARTEKLNDVVGDTATLAAVGRNSTTGAFKTLASTIEAIEISIFKILREDVVKITKATTEWAKANKAAFGKAVTDGLAFMKDNFDDIVRIGPRMLKFIVALWALVKVMSVIQVVLAVVATLTTITAGTLGLIVVAVVAVIAILALLVFFWDDVVIAMTAVGDYISSTFIEGINLLTDVWDMMVAGVKDGDPVWIAAAAVIALPLAPLMLLVNAAELLSDAWGDTPVVFSEIWDEIADSFFRQINAITDKIDELKRLANSFTGIQIFDDATKAGPRIEQIEGVRRANEFLGVASADELRLRADREHLFVGAPERLLNETLGESGIDSGGISTMPAAQAAQIVNTSQESRQVSEVTVNVKAPPGVVESVEHTGDKGTVTVTSSGDL